MRSGAGATIAKTGRRDRLVAWLSHHQRVCRSTLAVLLGDPFASLMTWLAIGIALGMPLILYVVLQNVSSISGDWGGKPRVTLYLAEEVTREAGQAFAREIQQRPGIDETEFVSSNSALQEFQRKSGFGDVLSSLDRNPLPHVIEVVPANPDPIELGELVSVWKANLLVENVSVDLEWLERLFALLVFAERLVSALAIVLGLGVMLVMGNTIRLAIENRRQEIEVIKLVGGTDAFVRRPFLYLGFWYGLGGAVMAFFLLQTSLYFLSTPVEMLAQSYRDDFALQGLGFLGNMLLLFGGSILGITGSVLAVSRHLVDIEPG
ncbi:permease-like cell division protein FtsX [Gammaproteobacteria bacterium]|nr:permease-like cell division protein FtsX [Gammaproteobacteria bacterium]